MIVINQYKNIRNWLLRPVWPKSTWSFFGNVSSVSHPQRCTYLYDIPTWCPCLFRYHPPDRHLSCLVLVRALEFQNYDWFRNKRQADWQRHTNRTKRKFSITWVPRRRSSAQVNDLVAGSFKDRLRHGWIDVYRLLSFTVLSQSWQ